MSKYNIEEIIRQMQDSPTAKLMRQIQDSPTAKLMRQMQDSPTAKLMRQMQDSPTAKLMRQMQVSPTAKMMQQIKDYTNLFNSKFYENSTIKNLLNSAQNDTNSFWQLNSTQHHLEELIKSHANLVSITTSLTNSFIEQSEYEKHNNEVAEENIFISDDINDIKNINASQKSKILNFIIFSIILNILINNLSSYIYEFHVQPIAKEYHSPSTVKEITKHIQANTYFDKSLLTPYRVTSKQLALYITPNLKSEILENISSFTLIQRVEESNLHKSWLKVRVEINGEIIEGYVLRRYTSPIR